MRRRTWAAVSASATLAALACGYLVVQGPSGSSAAPILDQPVAATGVSQGEASPAASTPTRAPRATLPATRGGSADSGSAGSGSAGSSSRGSGTSGPGPIETRLTEPAQGSEAVDALGDVLPAVAERAGLTADQLRGVLESDETAWVTPQGRVAYYEEIPTAPESVVGFSADPLTAPFPLADTFKLESLPGSTHTLYLDFDGVTVTSGNAWHTSPGMRVPVGTYAGWDPDDNGPAFSDAEKAAIQEIWARVAEDYAAFDINVTTKAPASQAALAKNTESDPYFGTRVAFSDAPEPQLAICGAPTCGGVAWTGVVDSPITDWAQNPTDDINDIAWVFPASLGQMASAMAEAASHEAGHTFGLVHDGDSATDDSYYTPDDGPGSKVWAPIMGGSYYNAVTQWSKGDYLGASNWWNGTQFAHQDDVAIIREAVGTRAATASSVTAPLAVDPGVTRYITRAEQVDTYALTSCQAGAVISASTAMVGANLDLAVRVVDEAGRSVVGGAAGSNPATFQGSAPVVEPWLNPSWGVAVAEGTGVSVTLPEAGGPYYVQVRGAGNLAGNWANGGYDSYGSLGAYTMAASQCDLQVPTATPAVLAPAAPQDLVVTQAAGGINVTWQSPVTEIDGADIGHYLVRIDDADPVAVEGTSFTALNVWHGSHDVTVRAVNLAGEGPAASATVVVTAPPGTVSGLTATPTPAKRSITVRWGAPTTGSAPDSYTATLRRGATVVATKSFAAPQSAWAVTGLAAGTYSATVVASNAAGSSTTNRSVTLAAAPTVAATPAPSIKAGKKGGKKTVVFSWKVLTKATAPRATAYKVVIYRVTKGKAKAYKTITATSTATSRELTLPAKKGVTYAFTVQVRNSVGWSAVSKRSKGVAPK